MNPLMVFLYATLLVCSIGVLFSIFMLRRNQAVFNYRLGILNDLYHPYRSDWKSRSRLYDSVSYDTMMWQFWRPLKSFGLEACRNNKEATKGAAQ